MYRSTVLKDVMLSMSWKIFIPPSDAIRQAPYKNTTIVYFWHRLQDLVASYKLCAYYALDVAAPEKLQLYYS